MKNLVPIAFVLGWIVFGDWLAGAALGTLALAWVLLAPDEGPPVLALAVTMQWVSVSIGFFYNLVTGRPLEAVIRTDYRNMVLLGLGCVLALIVGLALGRRLIERIRHPKGLRPSHALTFKTTILVYVVFTAVLSVVKATDYDFGGLAMAVVAVSYLRLGLTYLILRRLVARGDLHYAAAMLVVEIVLGISGFYASFREPLMMAALACLEYFDRRRVGHWLTVGALGTAMITLGIVWIGIRGNYRAQFEDARFEANRSARIEMLRDSVNRWATQSPEEFWDNIDAFVERMWTIYYPALAVDRVPSVLPHTDGRLMADTLRFVFEPRIFFPEKPDLQSDSQMVRRYSGVMVAGEEQNTDIAFGYAAESYLDYGVPGMFVPSFIWGLFMGIAVSLIFSEYHHRDMAVGVVTVIAWISLYLFERSWAKTIGMSGSMLIYAAGLCYVLDRLWFEKFKNLYGSGMLDVDAESAGDLPPAAAAMQLQPQQSK
jgi:hypothetical protein